MAGNPALAREVCLLSSFDGKEKITFGKFIRGLPNGTVLNSSVYSSDCTLVISKTANRGEKYLCGCIAGKPVLTPGYVTSSLKAQKWLPKNKFLWCNQKGKTDEEKLLISLATRCELYSAKNEGKKLFSDWKVLLHLPDKTKRAAYKRLLEAGGAKIINLAPPYHLQLKYIINFAFTTKEFSRDLKLLADSQFTNILYPEYISEYLVNIEAKDVKVSAYMHFKKVLTPKKATPNKQRKIDDILTKKRKSEELLPSRKKLCFSSNITDKDGPSSSTSLQDPRNEVVENSQLSNISTSSASIPKHPRCLLGNYSSPLPSKAILNDKTPLFSPSGLRIPPNSVRDGCSPLFIGCSSVSGTENMELTQSSLTKTIDIDNEDSLTDTIIKGSVPKYSIDDSDINEIQSLKSPQTILLDAKSHPNSPASSLKKIVNNVIETTKNRTVSNSKPSLVTNIPSNDISEERPLEDLGISKEPELLTNDSLDLPESMVGCPIVSSNPKNDNIAILYGKKSQVSEIMMQNVIENSFLGSNKVSEQSEETLPQSVHSNGSPKSVKDEIASSHLPIVKCQSSLVTNNGPIDNESTEDSENTKEPELVVMIDDDSLDLPESMVGCPIISKKEEKPQVGFDDPNDDYSTSSNMEKNQGNEIKQKNIVSNFVANNEMIEHCKSALPQSVHSNGSQQYFNLDEDSLDVPDSMVCCPLVDKNSVISLKTTKGSQTNIKIEEETVSGSKDSVLVKESQYFGIDEDSLDLPDSMVFCPIVEKKDEVKKEPVDHGSKSSIDMPANLLTEKASKFLTKNAITKGTKISVDKKENVDSSQLIDIDDDSDDLLNSMVCCPIVDTKTEGTLQNNVKDNFSEKHIESTNCISQNLQSSSIKTDPPLILEDSLDDLPECFVSCPIVKKPDSSTSLKISNQSKKSSTSTSTSTSKLPSKSSFFANCNKKKNSKPVKSKAILIDDSPLKKFVPINKEVTCIELLSDDDMDFVQSIDKDPHVRMIMDTPKKKDTANVKCISLDTPEKKQEENQKFEVGATVFDNGLLVHPSAALKLASKTADKRINENNTSHKNDNANLNPLVDNETNHLSSRVINESEIKVVNDFEKVTSKAPNAGTESNEVTIINRKILDDCVDNSLMNNKYVKKSKIRLSDSNVRKKYPLRCKTPDLNVQMQTNLLENFSDIQNNEILGTNMNCSTPKNRKSATPSKVSSSGKRNNAKKDRVSPNSSLKSPVLIKKEEPSEVLLKTPTKSRGKKKQSCISFEKSPSKFDAIKKEFEEFKVKEEVEGSPKISRSRFGRQRKPKKFSSDFVTSSTKKKSKSDKNSIMKFVKNDKKENIPSNEIINTRPSVNTNVSSSSKKDLIPDNGLDRVAIVSNDAELDEEKLFISQNVFLNSTESKDLSVNYNFELGKTVPKQAITSSKSISDVISTDQSPSNRRRSSRKKIVYEQKNVDIDSSSMPMISNSQNSSDSQSLVCENNLADMDVELEKDGMNMEIQSNDDIVRSDQIAAKSISVNTQDYVNYLPELRLERYIRPDSQETALERASFPRAVENMIEAYVDQDKRKDALRAVAENTSAFFYPKPKTIGVLFNNLFTISNDSQSILESAAISVYLYNLVLLHPVMTDTFYLALQKPVEDEDENVVGTVLPIEYIFEIVTDICDSLKVDPEDRTKDYKGQILLLEYIVHIIKRNFLEHFSSESLDDILCKNMCLDKLRGTLIWRILWGTCLDPGVNKNIKDLLDMTFNVITDSEIKDDSVSQSLITLISMAACCCSIKDTLNTGNGYSTCSTNLTAELCAKCDQVLFCDDVQLSTKSWFFKHINPSWLFYRIVEYLLIRYSEELVDISKKHLLRKSISLEKIIYCYFFLLPRHRGSSKKASGNTPLKDLKNVVNIKSLGSPSPKKTTKAKINRKNIRGETQLQVACIKNNPEKVKELLSLGADPNSKDNAGWTPLHEACNYGFVGCVEELLQSKDLDIYATNSEGISVLHDAVQNNHITIVEKLVERGGKQLLDLKTNANLTVYELAPTQELKDLLKKLSGQCSPVNRTYSRKHWRYDMDVELKTHIYANVEAVDKKDLEDYLYLLMMLLHGYLPHCQHTIDPLVLFGQVKLLKEHVNLIGKLSIPAKMYLRSISLLLAPDYV